MKGEKVMLDIDLGISRDKVKHNFDPGTFRILECDWYQGTMTVIREPDEIEEYTGYRSFILPHVITYSIKEMRYA